MPEINLESLTLGQMALLMLCLTVAIVILYRFLLWKFVIRGWEVTTGKRKLHEEKAADSIDNMFGIVYIAVGAIGTFNLLLVWLAIVLKAIGVW